MEPICCFLCDHEFVDGEEPWLMFEQHVHEDGKLDCSLAGLLSSILEKDLQEDLVHSTLLCDCCNADVLEYESLEKRFLQIRERILNSYNENCTIHNLKNVIPATTNSNQLPQSEVHNVKFFITHVEENENVTKQYDAITDMDLVEEVHDEYSEEEDDTNILVKHNKNKLDKEVSFSLGDNVKSEITSDHFDFAAFNEHVAQNSLPTGVLNLSDGLGNLDVSEKSEVNDAPLDSQNIIIYDVNNDNFEEGNSMMNQENSNSCDLKSYDSNEDRVLKFIINTDIFPSDRNCENTQQSVVTSEVLKSNDNTQNYIRVTKSLPTPVCKQDGDLFLCLICKISPQYARHTLIEHFQTFHNSKFYMCEQCHEGFAKRQDLKTHNEIGHIIQCNHCERTFLSNRLYRIHKRKHLNNIKPHECQVCQKMYVSKSALEEHMNTHTGYRPFKCTECPKDFASKYTLQTHMKIHMERPRPYQCDKCDKRFLNQQNLNQHKKLHVSVKAFQCDVCNKAFTTQHNLQVHKIVHSGKRPFLCRICGKSFARRPEIKDHERIHTGEKPFKCEYCPMAFAQRTNLASHKKSTHLNEKLHKCDICLRSFKRKRLLDYHIQAIHTGERPHKCGICGAGFVYPEHFKKHMLIHSGKKPYACEVCGKQFNSRDNRNAHRFVHSDKKPYECMECGAGFMRKPLLLTHMKQTKHLNDTIIINQPHFTQPQIMEIENSTVDYNNLHEEELAIDVDNDLKSEEINNVNLEEIIFQADDLLRENLSVSPTTNTQEISNGNVKTVISDQLIKGVSETDKYLEFDDLEHEGHQAILTWVHIGGENKV